MVGDQYHSEHPSKIEAQQQNDHKFHHFKFYKVKLLRLNINLYPYISIQTLIIINIENQPLILRRKPIS